ATERFGASLRTSNPVAKPPRPPLPLGRRPLRSCSGAGWPPARAPIAVEERPLAGIIDLHPPDMPQRLDHARMVHENVDEGVTRHRDRLAGAARPVVTFMEVLELLHRGVELDQGARAHDVGSAPHRPPGDV